MIACAALPACTYTGTRNQCSCFSGGDVVFKRDIGLFTRNSSFFMIRRCSRYTSRTTSGTAALLFSALLHLHQGLQVRHLLLAEDLLLLPTLHFRFERQRSRFAPCEGTRDSLTHRCYIFAVVGSRIAERSTRRCLSVSKGKASTS